MMKLDYYNVRILLSRLHEHPQGFDEAGVQALHAAWSEVIAAMHAHRPAFSEYEKSRMVHTIREHAWQRYDRVFPPTPEIAPIPPQLTIGPRIYHGLVDISRVVGQFVK